MGFSVEGILGAEGVNLKTSVGLDSFWALNCGF
jgi:hypothetical protein